MMIAWLLSVLTNVYRLAHTDYKWTDTESFAALFRVFASAPDTGLLF